MTDILCKWLNEEVKLSKRIEKSSLAQDFATGYFLGEILQKYQLQNDFDAFSTGQTADAKLNNFTRVEPTLNLLQIPFDSNVAYDIMMLKHGIATRLLYQLYIALQRKTKNKLTGAAMETMRASAPVNLERIETGLYQQRLKTLVPRESDLTLRKVSTSFIAKKEKNDRRALESMYREAEVYSRIKEEQRTADLEKARISKQKQTELLAKIQAATVHIPKPPPSTTLKAINQRREMRRKRDAAQSFLTIEKFERHLKKLVAPAASREGEIEDRTDGTLESSIEYLRRIKNRLEEDATAREERAKRRRKVLVDQMKAHQAQEEALRQEQVVQRLMRQSTQEKRIAVQLMQTRHQKDVIRKNRIFLEKQHEARRLKDFQDAMDREKELCIQSKADYEAELEREREVHEQLMNEKAQNRYRRHYEECGDVLSLIIDFALKIGEYRELTEKKVPDKLVREWREVLLNGQPLYPEAEHDRFAEIALAKNEILDSQDFTEYKEMLGEWNLPRDPPAQLAPTNNNILGHVLHRMFSLVAPTPPPTPPPQFPEFPIKVVVLGKMFSGKTTILKRLCREHNTVRLAIDQLLIEAVESFHAHEQEPIAPRSSGTLQDSPSAVVNVDPPTPTVEVDDKLEQSQPALADVSDGEEKKDPEKEVTEEEEEEQDLRKYSSRALLGKKAMSYLSKGEPVADEILIEILVEAIRKLPSGVGWALDGFPTTVQQAIMLEKSLTGKDLSELPSTKNSKKKSSLVSDPKPKPDPDPYVSGINMVLLVDVNDEIVLKRAHGRTEAKKAGELYHEEFRPPPPGSQTGQGKVEQVVSVEDTFFDKEQVQHRVTHFLNNWPELEKLYGEITTIRRVDGEAEGDEVYDEVEQCFVDTVEKLEAKPEAESIVAEEEPVKEEPPPVTPPSEPKPEDEQKRSSSAASRKSKDSGESGDKSRKSTARGRSKSSSKGDKKKGKSRPGSSKSPKGKKKTPSPAPPPEPVEEPTGPPPPEPGSAEWVYVDESISLELVQSLVPYWENTEMSYVKNLKFTLRQIRAEREEIIRYLYQTRVDFQDHLRRPDHKQIFVSTWQKDFNELSDDLRSDEESKAELHQRLDDLRERLWDICDTRKEQMETERANLTEEGWIEDHLGILTNHYLTIMQAEVDRFQDTAQTLKDYYGGMQSRIPGEVGPAGEFVRMPLVELDVGDPSVSFSAATLPSESTSSVQHSPLKQPKKSTEELAGQEIREGSATLQSIPSRTKIPLVQRGGPFNPQTGEEGGKSKKKVPSNAAQGSDSPTDDENPEERTISDAFNFAANVITTTVQSRISEKEAEEEEDRRLKEEEERAKAAFLPVEKKGGKSAKGGKQSAKGKKGKKSRSPTPLPVTPVEESEEEKKKKETVIRLREEYFAALHQEESNVKERLDLIKNRAQVTLSELRGKTDQSFLDMNEWLGARYLREMAGVDALTTYARQHIENAEKLTVELKLEQDEFIINNERKLIKSPVPPPRPPPVEVAQPETFTVVQLRGLFAQFQDVAPSGVIMSKAFVELLADTAALSYGFDSLPDMWMAISYNQLVDLCSILSPQSEYIDWRKFLLLAAQPWPKPTVDQLLAIRKSMVEVDVAGHGWITQDQYDRVDLWFPSESDTDFGLPEDDEDPLPYNRNRNLRDFFFELFSDWEQSPPRLDYINMLIYFAADKDSLSGFFKALSVASGEPMPKFSMVPDLLLYSGDNEVSTEDAIAPDFPIEQTTSFKRIHVELDPYPTPHIATESWWLVLHHGSSRLGDSHRFSMVEDPEEKYSMSRLRSIYNELGSEDGLPLPIQILVRHSVILEAIESTKRHKLPDIRSVFVSQALQALEIPDATSESFVAT